MDLNGHPGPAPVRREFAQELKFLLTPEKATAVQDWARANLQADPHGTGAGGDTYRIASLYYDTSRFDVFHDNGSFGRSKYRIRRYNGDTIAFLERKTKTSTWVSKRRSPVSIDLLPRLEEPEADSLWSGFWFHRRLLGRHLLPVCQISYLRTARIGFLEDQPVRMTLDREIHACPVDAQCYEDDDGTPLLQEAWIMELKFRRSLPALFKRLLTQLAPAPQRISKYRLAVQTLDLAGAAPARSVPRLEPADA